MNNRIYRVLTLGVSVFAFSSSGSSGYVNNNITTSSTTATSYETHTATIPGSVKKAKFNAINSSFGANVAYGKTFKNRFYVGGSLFGSFSTGTTTVQALPVTQTKSNGGMIGSDAFTYSAAMPDISQKITLKKNYSLGIGGKFGITEGRWLVYVPVNIAMTQYAVKFERNAADIAAYDNKSPSYTTVSGTQDLADSVANANAQGNNRITINLDNIITTTHTLASVTGGSSTPVANTNYKKTKTKVECSFGVGAAYKLSKKVSIDLCYTYSPNSTMTVTTPAYKSNALLDTSRLGETHRVNISSHKIKLGVSYHFG